MKKLWKMEESKGGMDHLTTVCSPWLVSQPEQECITLLLIRIIDGINSTPRHLHVVTRLSCQSDVNISTAFTQAYCVTASVVKYPVCLVKITTWLLLWFIMTVIYWYVCSSGCYHLTTLRVKNTCSIVWWWGYQKKKCHGLLIECLLWA